MTDENKNPSGYCTQCGSPLPEGAAFCVNCGMKVGDASRLETETLETSPEPAEPAPAEAVSVPQASAAEDGASVPAKPKKTGMIIGVVVAVVVVVAAICGAVFLMNGQGPSDGSQAIQEERSDAEGADLALTHEYETEWTDVAEVTYTTFLFNYPDSWEVESAEVDKTAETVVLKDLGSNVTVQFQQNLHPLTKESGVYTTTDVRKVADSDFWPTGVQDTNLSDRGPFAVAKLNVSPRSSSGSHDVKSYYAVVPESVVKTNDQIHMDLTRGIPQFDYAGSIGFFCEVPDGGMPDDVRDEVIAILSSFNAGTTEDDYNSARHAYSSRSSAGSSSAKGSAGVGKDGYILKDSASRVYSESELDDMSMYDLYLARNEIFARHGRMFSNQDLKDYFGSKTWYKGTVEPEDFSDSVLNKYEKQNVELILEMERAGNSPYLS